ncbi:MAG: CaiB/BaiF CoA transferase family protein [Marinosulfonomonas sp.]
MNGALKSLRILDATHVLAGPFCTYQLALMGADVIKIESPTSPDCARGRGPDPKANALGLGLNYQVQGGNKRALALDLATTPGRDVFLKLAKTADVFVENYTTGALNGLGLSYDDVKSVNPGIIYCSITGFGDTGPAAQTGAYDNVIQAASGTIAQCGGQKPGVSFIDYATGYSAAFAIMAAIQQRHETGLGCQISVSMLEVAMQMMAPEVAAAQHPVKAQRNKEPGISSYETREGVLMLGAFRPEQYRRLSELLTQLGQAIPPLADIQSWQDVWSIDDATRRSLEKVFAGKTADEWVDILHEADIPAERVQTLEEAVKNEQLAARGYFTRSPTDPQVSLPLTAFRFSQGGPKLTSPAPRPGQHSAELLHELGLSADDISALEREGVI